MAKKTKNQQSENDFNIALEGDANGIDVKTLATTLINMNSLIKEVNKANGNENEVSIQLKGFKPGSFDLNCSVVPDPAAANTLFGAANSNVPVDGAAIIGTVTELLSTREFLGSKKPKGIHAKNEESLSVKNSEGKTKVISTRIGQLIFNNPVINMTINNTFQALQASAQIEGISIKDASGKRKFKAKKALFKRLSNAAVEKKAKSEQKISKSKISLSIYKLVFGTNNAWDFYFEGNKISAVISDEKFRKRMLNGEIEFINGDIMVADIEINQEFNDLARVFENKKYVVTKVHDVMHLPSQSAMNFNPAN